MTSVISFSCMKSVSAAFENYQGINKIRKTIPDIYIIKLPKRGNKLPKTKIQQTKQSEKEISYLFFMTRRKQK